MFRQVCCFGEGGATSTCWIVTDFFLSHPKINSDLNGRVITKNTKRQKNESDGGVKERCQRYIKQKLNKKETHQIFFLFL